MLQKTYNSGMATVNLNLLTKTNITSILLSLHRFETRLWKKTNRLTNLQNKTKAKTMAASLLVLKIYKKIICPFFLVIIRSKRGVKFASQWKIKPKLYNAYWVILREMVQVTYLKIKNKKKGNIRNLCLKGCKNSVVDTSGRKHRECIVWQKSIITIKGNK